VRDPSIVNIGGVIWMANNNKTSSTFTLAKSTDNGNTFNHVANITVNLAGVDFVYAPEWFVDSDGEGSVHLFMCMSTDSGVHDNIYEMHPTNAGMTTWSDPVLVDEGDAVHNIIQDPYIIQVGSTYYLWHTTGDTVQYSSSDSLLGPYSSVVTVVGNYEGPCVIKLPSGTWRLYMDGNPGSHPGIYYSESVDAWAHWSVPVLCTAPITTRHGTIIPGSGDTSHIYSAF
jgi:hypothetical protein